MWSNKAILQPVTMSLGKMVFKLGVLPLYKTCLKIVELGIHKGCTLPFPYGNISENTVCPLCWTYNELMLIGLRHPWLAMPAIITAALADLDYQEAINESFWANQDSPVYNPESPPYVSPVNDLESPTCVRYCPDR